MLTFIVMNLVLVSVKLLAHFYPHDAMPALYLPSSCVCLSVRPSVRLSVTRQYCSKTAKRSITQAMPRESPGTLVFWRPQSFVGDTPFPWNWRSKWSTPRPLRTPQFRPISAHSASTVRSSEKYSSSTNRKSTTRFPTNHRWTVYVAPNSPKGWHKNAILLFLPVKFDISQKKSAAKCLCVKTSRGKVVATLFLKSSNCRQNTGRLYQF